VHSLEIKEGVDKIFSKLAKKNKKQLTIINSKIQRILDDPYHFKPLRAPMQNKRRVHIDKSFVLVYEVDEDRKTVTFWIMTIVIMSTGNLKVTERTMFGDRHAQSTLRGL